MEPIIVHMQEQLEVNKQKLRELDFDIDCEALIYGKTKNII